MPKSLRVTLLLAAVWSTLTLGCRRRAIYSGGPLPATRYSAGGELAGWRHVQPPGAGFACDVPGTPQVHEESGWAEDGAPYWTTTVNARTRWGTFGLVSTRWEGGIVGDALDNTRRLAQHIAEIGELQQRDARRLSIPGFYGREDVGRTSDGAFVAIRQFVGRERLYVAVAIVANQPGPPLRSAELFMESVALDEADTLLPRGTPDQPVPIFMPEVDFAARMPALTSGDLRVIRVDGSDLKVRTFESAGEATLRVSVIELAERPEPGLLGRVAEALELGEAGAPAHTSGYPGRAYASDDLRGRAFLTASRVYVLQASTGTEHDDAARAFFSSFRIL